MENKRDVTVDVMKGVGILLMLVGHWHGMSQWAHQFIYSFHMPLFFLVAGYFSKQMTDWAKSLKKNALRLLLPFVFTHFMLIGWIAVKVLVKHDVGYVLKPTLSSEITLCA